MAIELTYEFNTINLIQDSRVYSPREDSFFMQENLLNCIAEEAVEIGCGSGILVLSIALTNNEKLFFATDLNYIAALNTQKATHFNRLENVMVLATDRICCFRKNGLPRVVFFNPPYLPSNPELDDILPYTDKIQFVGGESGFEVIQSVIERLAKQQILYTLISSLSISSDYLQEIIDRKVTVIATMTMPDGEELEFIRVGELI